MRLNLQPRLGPGDAARHPGNSAPGARQTCGNRARSEPPGGASPRSPGTSTAAVPQPRRRRAAKRARRLLLAVPAALRCYHTDPKHHLRRHPASLKTTVSDSRAKEGHENPSSSSTPRGRSARSRKRPALQADVYFTGKIPSGRVCSSRVLREGPMSGDSAVRRVGVPTLLTAITSTGIAIVVIYATDWKTNPWAWIAVAALTVLSFCGSLWLYRRQLSAEPVKGTRIGKGVRISAKNQSRSAWIMRNVSVGTGQSKSQGPQSAPIEPNVEIKGKVNIKADRGSASAWSMDNVTMDTPAHADPPPPGP